MTCRCKACQIKFRLLNWVQGQAYFLSVEFSLKTRVREVLRRLNWIPTSVRMTDRIIEF